MSNDDAFALIDHYSDEHWWFDPDLVIHKSFNDLLAEIEMLRGALETYSGKPWEIAMREFQQLNAGG